LESEIFDYFNVFFKPSITAVQISSYLFGKLKS